MRKGDSVEAIDIERQELIRRVREIDPRWSPRQSATRRDSIESDIAKARGRRLMVTTKDAYMLEQLHVIDPNIPHAASEGLGRDEWTTHIIIVVYGVPRKARIPLSGASLGRAR